MHALHILFFLVRLYLGYFHMDVIYVTLVQFFFRLDTHFSYMYRPMRYVCNVLVLFAFFYICI